MARARPFLGEAQHSRYGKQKDKKGGHKTGQDEAVRPLYFIGAAQGKSFFQAQHTDADAEREAGKAGNGGKVAPGQTKHHAERAAEESESSDHDNHTQYKAQRGRGTGARLEFTAGRGGQERAQYEPDYFRAYVLDFCGAVHTKPARDITQEAGDAEAHIGGIACCGKPQRSEAGDKTGQKDETVVFVHRESPLIK